MSFKVLKNGLIGVWVKDTKAEDPDPRFNRR